MYEENVNIESELKSCQFCDRCFLPERLIVHNRSCTAFQPARKVAESVKIPVTTAPPRSPERRLPAPTLRNYRNQYSSYELNLDQFPHALEKLKPEVLSECAHCERHFLPSRLSVHAKSCTRAHPARRVGEPVKRICHRSPVATCQFNTWRVASAQFREQVRMAKRSVIHLKNSRPKQKQASPWKKQSDELRKMVKTARAAHDTVVPSETPHLVPCQFCDRCFLPERLMVHNRSCTAFQPARKVIKSPAKKLTFDVPSSPERRLPAPSLRNYRNHYSSYDFDTEKYPHAFQKHDRDELVGCGVCLRTFLPESMKVHSRSCTIDNPARLVGQPVCRSQHRGFRQTPSSSGTNWRAASIAFREAVRAAKQKEAQTFPSIVQCPACNKRFREKAAARHTPACEEKLADACRLSRSASSKWRRESRQLRRYVREARSLASTENAHIDQWRGVPEC